jgi:hypothetical protein
MTSASARGERLGIQPDATIDMSFGPSRPILERENARGVGSA